MNKKPSEPTASAGVKSCTNLIKTKAQQARLHSKELFGTAHEIVIEHAGDEYRLRLTRQGKLILTK
jgi:hemin uptake protein HemP